jgi:hypothetical protein
MANLGTGDREYVAKLEATLKRFMEPIDGIPLSVVVRALTGHRVLPWSEDDPSCKRLKAPLCDGVADAAKEIAIPGIESDRPNEVGNRMEQPVREALSRRGFAAQTPASADGRKQAMGYPDILLTRAGLPAIYLEVKTYNRANVGTTQRAFYCSPPLSKVSLDAYHLIAAFEIERRSARTFFPTAYRIIDVADLKLVVKHEFNASNLDLYGSCPTIASGSV